MKAISATIFLVSFVGMILTAESFYVRPMPFIVCVIVLAISSLFFNGSRTEKTQTPTEKTNYNYPKK